LPERWVRALPTEAIAPGGMLAVEIQGRHIVICRCEDGTLHAVARRCGHMNAPLEKGTLEGTILTCPLHWARFDVATGEVLGDPIAAYLGPDPLPPRAEQRLRNEALLLADIHTQPLDVYATCVCDGWVMVAL